MPGSRYDASTKVKAIRLVREHAGDYPTQWGATQRLLGRVRWRALRGRNRPGMEAQ
jgi:hypothetical protein